MTRRMLAAILWVAALAVSSARADEGRIPIFEPTVITAPGHYVVTRNITVAGGSIITIQANDVTVDLNGHALRSTATTGYLVSVPSIAPKTRRVTVRNGNLSGGARGVWAVPLDIRLEKLNIQNTNQAIYIEDAMQVEIRSCHLHGTGHPDWGPAIEVNSGAAGATARIVDNIIEGFLGGGGIRVTTLAEITGNVVTAFDLAGLELVGPPGPGRGSLVERNSFQFVGTIVINAEDTTFRNNRVSNNPASPGCALNVLTNRNTILDNILLGTCGVQVDGAYNRISGNQADGTDGMVVNGFKNLLESNLISGSGLPSSCGIRFAAINPDNVYRNNLVYGVVRICNVGRDGGGNL